jgi:glucosamine-6-phosphate deaminase
MRLIIKKDYRALSECAARIVADVVWRKPNAVLALPTGSTPLGMYEALISLHQKEGLNFSKVTFFMIDEYIGLPPTHPNTFAHYLEHHFFCGVNIPPEQRHLLSGIALDLEAQCLEYEQKIRDAGGIDLIVLGIGKNGHIAFCEPGSSLSGRTCIVALHPQTRADNARSFTNPEEVPRRAVTMGVGTIMAARVIMIFCSGSAKAEIWAHFVEGPVTAQLPASALHLHPCVIALCDMAAGEKLRNREYYLEVERELADQPLILA